MTSTYVLRAFDAVVDDVNQEDRTITARINTDEVDRYRTVIVPRGGRFGNYTKLGGPVLWEHGKDPRRCTDPIGRNLWIKSDGQKRPTLLAKTRFLDDDFAQQRYEWYRDGVLRAFSVNILPDPESASPPTREEISARPELADCQYMYRSWDLAEYSAVTIPGNASALTADRAAQLLACVERGLWLPDDVLEILKTTTETPEATRSTMTDDGGDDATQDSDGDDGGSMEESFDGSTLRCTERHAMGHCPMCGEPGIEGERSGSMCRCHRGHEFESSRAIECPYKEPERTAPEIELPPLTGRSFAEIRTRLAIKIHANQHRMLKEIEEKINLKFGRV